MITPCLLRDTVYDVTSRACSTFSQKNNAKSSRVTPREPISIVRSKGSLGRDGRVTARDVTAPGGGVKTTCAEDLKIMDPPALLGSRSIDRGLSN